MDSLAQILERFNRKERNLLIRTVLDCGQNKPPQLSEGFCQKVTNQLGLDTIPSDAWWGTDYHINWLAGALTIFMNGEAEVGRKRYPNPHLPIEVSLQGEDSSQGNKRQLVEGNQEDVDLVIATERDLILIEAKAYSTFGNPQIASKIDRLNLLHDFYEELAASGSDRVVRFHLLLLSPKKPQNLERLWPNWAPKNKESEIPWIKLQTNATPSILNVTRCDENGLSMAAGTHWHVINYQSGILGDVHSEIAQTEGGGG
ncbi:MAG TPA: hypothetical protein VMI52_08690, partial [Acetobacteraceae bacterium]|nr:hypothetical protein [Acetobacteraceae bacterium]